jgi:1,4-alpha-glucan branching enzyme
VCLVGSFNDWSTKKHPMKRGENGTWTANVMLSPGTYEYRLLVDGHWADDPRADRHVPNEFGSTNAIRSIAP